MIEPWRPFEPASQPGPPPGPTDPPLGDCLPEATHPASPPVAPPRNFCDRCGAPWDSAWTACPVCSAAAQAVSPAPPVAFVRDRRIASALLLYGLLLAASAVGIILIRVGAASEIDVELYLPLVDSVLVLLWVAASFGQIRPSLATAGRLYYYPLALALGALSFLAASLAVKSLVAVLGIENLRYSDAFLDAGYGWPMIVLAVCLQPAVVEELAFRGVILGRLRGPLGLSSAVVVSALLFMVLHLNVLSFPHLLLIGLLLGFLRIRSGSLYPCMLMHFTHNLLVILAEWGGW